MGRLLDAICLQMGTVLQPHTLLTHYVEGPKIMCGVPHDQKVATPTT